MNDDTTVTLDSLLFCLGFVGGKWMRIVETVKTAYNHVDVWERLDGYDFEVAGGTHATWSLNRILTGYAWDAITAGVLLRSGPLPRSVLMLGLGGGTGVRQIRHLLPRARITAVEIDSEMVELGRRYMHLDELEVEVVVGDGYEYLDGTSKRFDVVVDDIYLGSGDDVARPVNYNERLMERLLSCASSGGTVVTNLVTGRGHQKVQRAVRQAFRERFPSVRVVKPARGFNESLVGGDALCGDARLEQFTGAFESARDEQFWRRVKVMRLR